jgi:DNA-binding NarL/FixJ family response regulator
VLIFTMHDNDALIEDVLMAGARGYLLKSDANRHLIDAIEALSSHKPFFSAKISEALLESFRQRGSRGTSPLTSRERSVLQLIAEGHTNKEVSGILNISLKTVESHRAAIMRKLNLSSSAALVRYAVRNKTWNRNNRDGCDRCVGIIGGVLGHMLLIHLYPSGLGTIAPIAVA